jgi:arginase
MKRRDFCHIAGALMVAGSQAASARVRKPVSLVLAPTSLGLRPNANGSVPGAWRAPGALMSAGLGKALDAAETFNLTRPHYQSGEKKGTRIRNGHAIRAFSLEIAEKVRGVLDAHGFPVVIGGDCSVLLGGLYGLRLAGGRGLVHIDGHSDFSNPANYDTTKRLGSVAGMDLALASGRGEELLTTWPSVGNPLAADTDIIQIGERESGDPEFYSDFLRTGITSYFVQKVLTDGIAATIARVAAKLEANKLTRVWMHVDLDVLDETVMPAVDSPGRPGLNYEQLSKLMGGLVATGRIAGAEFTIYDPDRDPDGQYARPIVDCIAAGLEDRA